MSEDREPLPEGTLISHLLELRTRLLRAFIAVMIAFLPCAYYSNALFEFISKPLISRLPPGGTLIATSVTTPFTAPFKLAFVAALLIAMPYVLYQVWAFVRPGLYRHEIRFALPLLVSSILLFYAGVAFSYWIVFPLIFKFFIATAPRNVALMADISNYLKFVLTLFVAFGVAFEVPIAVVLLVLTGLVTVEKLQRIRGYVLIFVFIIAAILTPPDALSQTTMAVPMYLLYEGGILFARIMRKHQPAEAATEETDA
ncbi:MAG: twin-arginine translocase subunit TatC [Steroidobacterales bacterium]